MSFPIYRKYTNELSFFKIESNETLIEIKIIGSYYQENFQHAIQLPDRNFVMDLIELSFGGVVEILEEEFDNQALKIKSEKKTLP